MLVIECDCRDCILLDLGGQPVGFNIVLPGSAVVDVEERPKVGVHLHHLDCPDEVVFVGPIGPDVGNQTEKLRSEAEDRPVGAVQLPPVLRGDVHEDIVVGVAREHVVILVMFEHGELAHRLVIGLVGGEELDDFFDARHDLSIGEDVVVVVIG